MWLSGGACRSIVERGAGLACFGACVATFVAADEAAGDALGVGVGAGLWARTRAGVNTAVSSTAAHRGERMACLIMGTPQYHGARVRSGHGANGKGGFSVKKVRNSKTCETYLDSP